MSYLIDSSNTDTPSLLRIYMYMHNDNSLEGGAGLLLFLLQLSHEVVKKYVSIMFQFLRVCEKKCFHSYNNSNSSFTEDRNQWFDTQCTEVRKHSAPPFFFIESRIFFNRELILNRIVTTRIVRLPKITTPLVSLHFEGKKSIKILNCPQVWKEENLRFYFLGCITKRLLQTILLYPVLVILVVSYIQTDTVQYIFWIHTYYFSTQGIALAFFSVLGPAAALSF